MRRTEQPEFHQGFGGNRAVHRADLPVEKGRLQPLLPGVRQYGHRGKGRELYLQRLRRQIRLFVGRSALAAQILYSAIKFRRLFRRNF